MSREEFDSYMAELDEPARSTLLAVSEMISELLPEAEQGIAYGAPVFRVAGKNVAGIAAYKSHQSYLPHSGDVLESLQDELVAYEWSKGALKFAVDAPLPRPLVEKLVAARLSELDLR